MNSRENDHPCVVCGKRTTGNDILEADIGRPVSMIYSICVNCKDASSSQVKQDAVWRFIRRAAVMRLGNPMAN